MIKELEKLGLNTRQAKVYLALTKLGECTIGALEKKLKMFKQSIYNTLKELEAEDFIQVTKMNNRQYFTVNDHHSFLHQLHNKERLAKIIIPELYALSDSEKYLSDVKIYGGNKAFHVFHEKMLKQAPVNSHLYVIGAGGDDFLKVTQNEYFFDRYENIRIDRRIYHNLIMHEDQRETNKKYIQRKYVEVKYLPKRMEQPMAIQIWPDRVALILFGNNLQIIEIKSAKIVKGFKGYFDMLWTMAKK